VETRLVVKGDPCERHNGTNKGKVTFVSQSSKNAFVLPSQEFTLDDAYSEGRVLRVGRCNYVELIDTIFTDVEGVD
jgi:hypothetical protein